MVKSDVKFIVRIIPSPKRDWECVKVEKNRKTIHIKSSQTYSLHPDRSLYWEFNTDGIFTDSCQDAIYNKVTENTLNKIFKGVDMVIIAFGQSDTGKTYTMMGLEDGYNYRGIAPRIIKDTLAMAEKFGPGMEFYINLSFVEFDNNKCYDLLKSPPEMIDFSKVIGVPITCVKDGLVALFDGEKRRKFEKMHNHCTPCVVTVHLKGVPVSGSSTSNIFSSIHLVDMPGTEKQYTNVRSDPCQAVANLTKLDFDKAKTWDNILAKQNGGCQVMGRIPPVFKTSALIQYLGRSITNGVLRLIGHIRAEHSHLKNTLWTLKYGGRLSKKQPGEMLYTFSPDYKRLTQLLEEEVKQLRDEIVVSELHRGEYTQLNMCQAEMEHLERLAKSYVEGRVNETCLLSSAKPNVILHALKKIYINELSDIKTVFKTKLKKASEHLLQEMEDKSVPKKRYQRPPSPPEPVRRSTRDSVGIGMKGADRELSTAAPTTDTAKSRTASSAGLPTTSADQPERAKSELKPGKQGKKGGKASKTNEVPKETETVIPENVLDEGRASRKELWNEWAAKNQEKSQKLANLKEAYDSSTIENEKSLNEVTELRNRLLALQAELEEARWQRMVNFGEHPGMDGARLVTSAAEQALAEEIKVVKKDIYDKVAHMVNEHKEHMRKFNEYSSWKISADASFNQYVTSTQMPMVIFPPQEDMDVVPPNPTTVAFQTQANFGETRSEVEFAIFQSKRLQYQKFKPKKKWH